MTPPPHTRVEDVCLATPFSPHENDETGKGVTKSGPLDAQKTSKKKHTQRQREKTLETARRRKRRRDQREERSLAKRDEEERNRESERPKSDDDDDDERYISHSFVASVFFFRYN